MSMTMKTRTIQSMLALPETSFHLYSDKEPTTLQFSPSSSIFDMISSSKRDLEPKQTKALAYMLSYSRPFAKAFCSLVSERNTAKIQCRVGKRDRLSVFAESRFQDKRQRADIVLLNRDERGWAKWTIVVEAKSWNRILSDFGNVDEQVKRYCEAIQKEWNLFCPIIPVLLIQSGSGVASATATVLSWDDIRSIADNLKSSDRLMKEFKMFFAGDKTMTTFEKEVLSVPAASSCDFIKKHYVYTCPPQRKGRGNKPFLYLAIREGNGGRMDCLFKVVRKYILPKTISEINKMSIPDSDLKQIRGYWLDPKVVKFADQEYKGDDAVQFYVLDKKRSIRLRTPMRPAKKNWRSSKYLELFDFFGESKDSALVPAE